MPPPARGVLAATTTALVLAATPRAAAQSAPRRVVIVADAVSAPAARALARSLTEMLGTYRVAVTLAPLAAESAVAAAEQAPDALATLWVHRDASGAAVTLNRAAIPLGASRRPGHLAIRVATALRDALADAPPQLDASEAQAPERPFENTELEPAPERVVTPAVPPDALAGPAQGPLRRRRASAPRWFLDAAASLWMPVGQEPVAGALVRLSAVVSGTSRSGLAVGVSAWVLAPQPVSAGQIEARVWQLPVSVEFAWRARSGRVAWSGGGAFATALTSVDGNASGSTLAFGAGLAADVAVRVLGPFSVVVHATALTLGQTTLTQADGPSFIAIGPFFGAASLGVRAGLP